MPNLESRYAVTFTNKTAPMPEAADLLKRNLPQLKNAFQTLQSEALVQDSDVLHFPELGVSYLQMTQAEADALAGTSGVVQVRKTKSVTSRLMMPPTVAPSPRALALDATPEPIPWNIALVRANEVWDRVTGAGVKVGIIDSGIDRSHPDLTVIDGACFVPGITDWDDVDDGHGTACAGIVGARRNDQGVVGVAPNCDLYALKVSKGGRSNTDWMLAAMLWAAEKRLDVVSISLWDDDGASAPDEPAWLDMSRGSEMLMNNGCLTIGIAGNSGGFSNHWVTNPARADGIVAVGSVDRARSWAPSSSYGPNELAERQAVELAAPGADVRSTWRGSTYADHLFGTSFSCPHVTGAVALLKQLHPTWSPNEILNRLKRTAADLLEPGRDAKTGWGLIDCYRAVTDPIADDRVVNEIIGTVQAISRQGDAHLIRFTGPVSVQDFESTRMIADVVLTITPALTASDVAMIASSLGRQLAVFGLIMADASDDKIYRAPQLIRITVT